MELFEKLASDIATNSAYKLKNGHSNIEKLAVSILGLENKLKNQLATGSKGVDALIAEGMPLARVRKFSDPEYIHDKYNYLMHKLRARAQRDGNMFASSQAEHAIESNKRDFDLALKSALQDEPRSFLDKLLGRYSNTTSKAEVMKRYSGGYDPTPKEIVPMGHDPKGYKKSLAGEYADLPPISLSSKSDAPLSVKDNLFSRVAKFLATPAR